MLLRTTTCRRLTWQGWLLVFIVGIGLLGGGARAVYPFLALNNPLSAKVLVVEGWMPDNALEQAAKEFRDGGYEIIVTAGGPIGMGSRLIRYASDSATIAALTLREMGIDSSKVHPAPNQESIAKDRTFHRARAVENWLRANGWKGAAINVCSLGPHARRTALLYELAMPGRSVGVISLSPGIFGAENWYRSSAGVRMVVGEWIAYLYARLLFSTQSS